MRARPYRSLSAVLQPELPQNRTFAVDRDGPAISKTTPCKVAPWPVELSHAAESSNRSNAHFTGAHGRPSALGFTLMLGA